MKRVILALTYVALVTAGCSRVAVEAHHSTDADFGVYQTWDWLPGGPQDTGDYLLDDPKVHGRVEAVIAAVIEKRG